MPVKPIAAGPGAGTEGLEPAERPGWVGPEYGYSLPDPRRAPNGASHQERMDALNPHAKTETISDQIAAHAAQSNRLWAFFAWQEIEREAALRLAEARHLRQNIGPLDTLQYWCAWCAHANLTAIILAPK